MLIGLSTWLYLEITMQDEVTIQRQTNNNFFESAEEFIYLETTYLGTTLTNQKLFRKKLRAH